MGNRYELIRDCVYCGKTDDGVYYAPTCNFFTFTCEKCGRKNFITSDLKVKKMEEVTYEDIYEAVSMASNMMSDKQIEDYAKGIYSEWNDELQRLMKEKLKKIENERKDKVT